jgi:valacyclovir hydrolase
MPFAQLPTEAKLYYVDSGQAEKRTPVVLIHGLLGTAETEYPQVIEWLNKDYRVIAPTLRGYGKSTPKPRTFPHDFYQRDADDVVALIDTLQLGKAHIIGYSDGGETALIAAGKHPDRFASVTTWGAVGYFGQKTRAAAQRMFPATWISDEHVALHGIENADGFILGWIRSIHRIIDSGGDLSLSSADKINAPLLLMLGDQDTLNPIEYGQKFVDKAQNGNLETFNCGHAIHNEAWEEFQKVVGKFLSGIAE